MMPKRDIAMGLAMFAPGERTDVQLLDSHSTSSLVSIVEDPISLKAPSY